MMAGNLGRKALLRLVYLILVLLLIAAVGYTLFGEKIIRDIYQGKSIGLLNGLISGESRLPVEEYLKKADQVFWNQIIGFPITILFVWLVYTILKYFFVRMDADCRTFDKPTTHLLKYDLVLACLIYTALTLLFFYPCLSTFGTHLIGPPEDNMVGYWDLWWGNDKVLRGSESLTFANLLFYPQGSSLYYVAWSFYNLLLSFPLRLFLNPVAVYNLIMLHTFPLAGIGAFLLARYITKDTYLALIAGFIFAFSPSHFARAQHHIHINSIQFIPLFVLFFVRAVREGTWRNLFLAALFFLLNALCDWNYMFFAGYFMAFGYVYLAIRRRRLFLKDVAAKIAVVTGATLLILSPWLWKMVTLGLQHREATLPGHNFFVTDMVSLVVPGHYHWFDGIQLVSQVNASFTGYPWETASYLGLVSLIVVLLSFRAVSKTAAKYFIGGVAFLLLAFGTNPHLLGITLPIRLPDQVLSQIPFFSNLRCPSRFIAYVYLFWGLIVAFAIRHVLGRIKSGKARIALAVAMPLLLAVDYFSMCQDKTEVTAPACYQVIAQDTEEYGILNLPEGYVESCTYMMYQTIHGLPIANGAITRKIGRSLIDTLELVDLSRQKEQLTAALVKYTVIHKGFLPNVSVNPASYRDVYQLIFEDERNLICKVY